MKKIANILLGIVVASATLAFQGCKEETSNSPIYPVDCGNYLVGTYAGSDYCTSTGQNNYACNITANTPLNITFSNLGGVQVSAVLDCDKNTITIPAQTLVGNFSVSGTGTYTANRIIINWTGISAGGTVNCSTTFTR